MDASNFSRLIQLLLCTLGYISVISIYYLPGWMAIDIYLFTCILRLWAPWGQVRHLIHYCIPSPSFVSSTQPDTWSSMCSTCVFWDDVLISWALVWLLSLCLLFTLIIPPPNLWYTEWKISQKHFNFQSKNLQQFDILYYQKAYVVQSFAIYHLISPKNSLLLYPKE